MFSWAIACPLEPTATSSVDEHMNVLLVVPWDNLGGVCAVVNRVAKHMRAQGHGVYILLPGVGHWPTEGVSREGHAMFRLNIRSCGSPTRSLRSRLAFALTLPGTLVALAALIRRLRIDVINVHFPDDSSIDFAILRRLGFAKLVTSVHGADLLPAGTRLQLPQWGVGSLLASSDLIVTPSNAYRGSVRQAWPEIAGKSMESIPNGVDPDELGYCSLDTNSASESPYILSILQLVHYKGADVLIRAFAEVSAEFDAYRLKLVSDGPQRAEYEALARSLGIAERVDFLGKQQRPEVADLLRDCTLFVLPSRSNSESFGIAAAEAMALDRAVIASRVGGLPDLVDDEVTGLLVAPGDVAALANALRRLLDDAVLRRRLGENAGRKIRAAFLWTHTVVRYEAALRRVVGQAAELTPRP